MRGESKIIIILIIVLTFISGLTIFKLLQNFVFDLSIARYKLITPPDHHVNDTKVILFWNNFFHFPNWGMPNETNYKEFLETVKCPMTNCILTHDNKFLSAPELYDALVFHGSESWRLLDLPVKRSDHQFYVLATLE